MATTLECARAEIKLEVCEGADKTVTMRWAAEDEAGVRTYHDLTGYEAKMQIRDKIKDDTVLLELSTDNSKIEIVTPQTGDDEGKYRILFLSADTEDICGDTHKAFTANYDLFLIDTSGATDVRRAHIFGTVYFYPATTRDW